MSRLAFGLQKYYCNYYFIIEIYQKGHKPTIDTRFVLSYFL